MYFSLSDAACKHSLPLPCPKNCSAKYRVQKIQVEGGTAVIRRFAFLPSPVQIISIPKRHAEIVCLFVCLFVCFFVSLFVCLFVCFFRVATMRQPAIDHTFGMPLPNFEKKSAIPLSGPLAFDSGCFFCFLLVLSPVRRSDCGCVEATRTHNVVAYYEDLSKRSDNHHLS